jgi:hypothetical protein
MDSSKINTIKLFTFCPRYGGTGFDTKSNKKVKTVNKKLNFNLFR